MPPANSRSRAFPQNRWLTAIKKHGQRDVTYVADRETLPEYLAGIYKPGDIVMTLGAGNIWQAGEGLLKRLQGK